MILAGSLVLRMRRRAFTLGPNSRKSQKREQKSAKRQKQGQLTLGNPNGGLANGGLARKAPANWAKKGPFEAVSALPLVPIGPEKAPTGPEKAPICPKKARFSRKDFPLIFSENLGLKPPFVSPRLDFPS